MKNSAKYRVPPIARTRDTFIDDRNSQENPRIDLGDARHTQVRRDKDTVKSIGITLYDVDFAVKSFIDKTMQLKVEDNDELLDVPTLYANSEKWASIQKNGYLKDKKGKTLAPLIIFRRSNVAMTPALRRNKVATTNQLAYVMGQKYNKTQPYDRFTALYGSKKQQEYFVTPIPDYVDITYDFILWAEYQTQLNSLIEQFVWHTGQSFGEANWFKFASNMENVTLEDSNITGQDRLVKANFQITVHAYLLPKNVAGDITTKRLVSPNKITFVSEAFADINSSIQDDYKSLNTNPIQEGNDLEARLNDYTANSITHSPDVYTQED